MDLRYFFVLLEITLAASMSYQEVKSMGTLVAANVLYRHGDRTPLFFYPNDPYQDQKFWPEGLGELTNAGKQRLYGLGQWLAQHYKDLLGTIYSPDNIYVLSTDVDRCLMSAQASLAGMYPPRGWQIWSQLDWQPIPVHTVPLSDDKILAMQAPCPRFLNLLNDTLTNGLGKRWADEARSVMRYVSKHSGMEVKSVIELALIHNTLEIEEMLQYKLPKWVDKVYPEPLRTICYKCFKLATVDREMQRLRSGPLLKEMISHFTNAIEGTLKPRRKVWIYSAHDVTVADLLNTLKMFNNRAPPFAATVLLELRRSNETTNKYTVNVLLKNETSSTPYVLRFPGCSEACPFEQLVSLTEDVIPKDWNFECLPQRTPFRRKALPRVEVSEESILPEGWATKILEDI